MSCPSHVISHVWQRKENCLGRLGALSRGDTCFPRMPDSVANDVLQQMQRFVVVMYNMISTFHEVNKAKIELFAHRSKNMVNIPSTQAALLQHIKRSTYQAGYIWRQCFVTKPVLPDS